MQQSPLTWLPHTCGRGYLSLWFVTGTELSQSPSDSLNWRIFHLILANPHLNLGFQRGGQQRWGEGKCVEGQDVAFLLVRHPCLDGLLHHKKDYVQK